MGRRKHELGRPLKRVYPPRIDATPEEIAERFMRVPGDAKVKEREYQCAACGKVVNYPDVLNRADRCSECA